MYIVLFALLLFAAGTLLPYVVRIEVPSSQILYLLVILLLGLFYTFIPAVRDEPEALVVWPGVVSLLVAAALWTLLPSARLPYLPVILVLIGVFLLLAIFLVVAGSLIPFDDPTQFMNPILLSAIRDTRPGQDNPARISVPIVESEFRASARLAAFLRKEKLADLVLVRRNRMTVYLSRVAGLPRLWSILLLPFGRTTVRFESRGVVDVSVDRHVYRLLERPGPYAQYVSNIVSKFATIAAFVSEGRFDEARRAAGLEEASRNPT